MNQMDGAIECSCYVVRKLAFVTILYFDTEKDDRLRRGVFTDTVVKLCETVPQMKDSNIYFDRSNRLSDVFMKEEKVLGHEGRCSMDYRITQVDGIELYVTRWFDDNITN